MQQRSQSAPLLIGQQAGGETTLKGEFRICACSCPLSFMICGTHQREREREREREMERERARACVRARESIKNELHNIVLRCGTSVSALTMHCITEWFPRERGRGICSSFHIIIQR
jgi:hypothetical protein